MSMLLFIFRHFYFIIFACVSFNHVWTTILRFKQDDLKRSPDLLNNIKIGQGQLQFIMKHILFYQMLGLRPF